jgi:RNA polymerase sigma-70 factor (ECF subfamily)
LGLENYPHYRVSGRLENYLAENYSEDTNGEFGYLCQIIKSASENIAVLYKRLNKDRQRVFRVLCETTVADMAEGKFADIKKIEFEEIYEKYFSKIYNYIYYRVSNSAAADDLTSDTFYKAYLYYDKYDAKLGSRYTWLCAIARNVVNTNYKKSNRVGFVDALDENIISGDNTELEVEERELVGELGRLVFELPEKYRELVVMKYTLGKTNREIAKETGLSESNVGTILNRIVEKLRKKLETYV